MIVHCQLNSYKELFVRSGVLPHESFRGSDFNCRLRRRAIPQNQIPEITRQQSFRFRQLISFELKYN